MSRMYNPAHPGEILREFIPEDMTVTEFARRLFVSRVSLSKILNGKSGISAEMAVRIGLLTGTTPESWLENQVTWDLWRVSRKSHPKIEPLVAMEQT
ncbi:MAG: HigA family addiction module antitoxin [Leptospirillum sp.]